MTTAEPPVLSVRRLWKRFGGLVAVSNCSFDVAPGSVVGLIGPNGSGKSTLFDLITGVTRPDGGEVYYRGEPINGTAIHHIARRGIGRTYQTIRLFRNLSVWMNLEIAAMGRHKHGWHPKGRYWLEQLGIDQLANEPAGSLSVGQQRLLELAMNLVVEPDFFMLDEPFAGVNPVIRDLIVEVIAELRRSGRTFLIIEHHMNLIMSLCDAIVVMDHGVKIAEGPPDEIRHDQRVLAALLGQSVKASP
jgi:ABC-type branched-subunit amino acid transport system ATPase component